MVNFGIYIENGRVIENGLHTGLYTSRYYAKNTIPTLWRSRLKAAIEQWTRHSTAYDVIRNNTI